MTSFVTRGSGADAELLVFRHAGASVQVPAGSVEEGESFEVAGRREAAEETGLAGLELVAALGSRMRDLPAGRAVLGVPVALQTRPGGPETNWRLGRVELDVVAQEDGYARIVYSERDVDHPDGLTYARFEGWVPAEHLRVRQERAFFHFRATGPTPERWEQQAEPEHVFHLYWVPLDPMPAILPAHQWWLRSFHPALVANA